MVTGRGCLVLQIMTILGKRGKVPGHTQTAQSKHVVHIRRQGHFPGVMKSHDCIIVKKSTLEVSTEGLEHSLRVSVELVVKWVG